MQAHASVRRFTDEPVDDELLQKLIEAGTRASTSGNMQAYTVISIRDPEHKKHLARLCADQEQIHQAPVLLAFCADLHRLTLTCRMHGVPDYDTGPVEGLLLAVVDTALVMENVAVAAESVGLGICMIGAMRNQPLEVKKTLRLPEHVFALSGMCIGWPARSYGPKPRLPLDAVWHQEHYRSDDQMLPLIEEYDKVLAAFYNANGMHPKEPRWSVVMSKRFAGMKSRAEVGPFLRAQGFNTQFD